MWIDLRVGAGKPPAGGEASQNSQKPSHTPTGSADCPPPDPTLLGLVWGPAPSLQVYEGGGAFPLLTRAPFFHFSILGCWGFSSPFSTPRYMRTFAVVTVLFQAYTRRHSAGCTLKARAGRGRSGSSLLPSSFIAKGRLWVTRDYRGSRSTPSDRPRPLLCRAFGLCFGVALYVA